MNIELRAVKYVSHLSEETHCFDADIYVDGRKAGRARDEGHGGEMQVEPASLRARLNAYGATLPKIPLNMTDPATGEAAFIEEDAETLIGGLVNDWLARRAFRRDIGSHLIWTRTDKPGLWTSKRMTKAALAQRLSNPALARTLAGCKDVLNLLPEARAFDLYWAWQTGQECA